MREICKHGSEGGAAQLNAPFLPLSLMGQKNNISRSVITLDVINGECIFSS